MRLEKWLPLCLVLAAPVLADPPPPLSTQGTVNEWGGPHRFHVPPGAYVLEADPITSQGTRLGGAPTGDVGKELRVVPGKSTPAYVYYDPLTGPPEFEEVPGLKYVYVVNAEHAPPLVLEFRNRDEAVYYLGEDVVRQLEEGLMTLPDGTKVPVMSWQPENRFQTEPACRYLACAAVEQAKAQEVAERWESFVTAVSEVVEAIVNWIVEVVEAIVNWFLSLFG